MRRSELLTEAGDYRGALRGYHKVLTLSERDPDMYMDVVKKIAGVHFKCGELEQAYDVLLGSFEKFPDHVTTTGKSKVVEVDFRAVYFFTKLFPSLYRNEFAGGSLHFLEALHQSDVPLHKIFWREV